MLRAIMGGNNEKASSFTNFSIYITNEFMNQFPYVLRCLCNVVINQLKGLYFLIHIVY